MIGDTPHIPSMIAFRIALANLRHPATPAESVQLTEQAIVEAGADQAGLVCFPECFVPGYRGLGPVRVGNQAYEQVQHDAYGQIVLSNVQAFFDQRLFRMAGLDDFRALDPLRAPPRD